jgi:hypothetical protein
MTPEELDLPEYMNHPIIEKYVGRMHLLIDDLFAETDEVPQDCMVIRLKAVLMTIHRRILFDGELDELDSILRMHFPTHYDKELVMSSLVGYPLSTSN